MPLHPTHPLYKLFNPDAPEMPEEEKAKLKSATYECGCHCGYIKYAVTLNPPLPEYEVLDCNCSMCRKAGYLLVCKSTPLAYLPRFILHFLASTLALLLRKLLYHELHKVWTIA